MDDTGYRVLIAVAAAGAGIGIGYAIWGRSTTTPPAGDAISDNVNRAIAAQTTILINDPSRGKLACVMVDTGTYTGRARVILNNLGIHFACSDVQQQGANAESYVRTRLTQMLTALDPRIPDALDHRMIFLKNSYSDDKSDPTGLLYSFYYQTGETLPGGFFSHVGMKKEFPNYDIVRNTFEAMVHQILIDCGSGIALPSKSMSIAVPVKYRI